MTINIFNLLILLGAIHGLMLSALLVFSKKRPTSGNILLAMLMVFYTLPVLRAALLDMSFSSHYDLRFFSIELLYGLGPSLYLYTKTVSDPKNAFRGIDILHFLPVLLELAYYLSPVYRQFGYYTIGAVQDVRHAIWMVQQAGSVVSILIYLVLTNRLLLAYSRWVKGNYSDTANRTLRWLQKPVILYSSFFVLWLALRVIDVLMYQDSIAIDYYYPFLILLSFSTYWIGTKGYLQTQVDAVGFSDSSHPQTQEPGDEALDSVFNKLEVLMSQEKLYLDGELNLSHLAMRLEINPRLLSKVINTRAKMNFYDYVNRHRVEEFKRKVIQPQSTRKLLDLAYECGFNSKATFNHVFKKSTGLTPTQYRRQVTTECNEPKSDGSIR